MNGNDRYPGWIPPERVAYWYFRLNGFLTIENFIVHPDGRGPQRTDADLLAVRFPHRREFLFERRPMEDDDNAFGLSRDLVDVVIAEVKTNDPCRLNGPWTNANKRNVERVLAAIGSIPSGDIGIAAEAIYKTGTYVTNDSRIRLVAVGRRRSDELAARFPSVTQLVWEEMLAFINSRFHTYRFEKRDVGQWDDIGRLLRDRSTHPAVPDGFISEVLRLMGVRPSETSQPTD